VLVRVPPLLLGALHQHHSLVVLQCSVVMEVLEKAKAAILVAWLAAALL
jgi:hypothetical protein